VTISLLYWLIIVLCYCLNSQRKLEADVDKLSQLNGRLKAELDDSERQRARLELTVQQLRGNVRDLTDKLKTEKDEVSFYLDLICYVTSLSLEAFAKTFAILYYSLVSQHHFLPLIEFHRYI